MTMFLAAVALLQVQVRDEPKDWKLIATENFNIYYPSDELLPRAREFAAWFERARKEHVQTMGVQPQRIHVFLYRSYHDLQQSSFLASERQAPLRNRIFIHCQASDRWNYWFLKHELAHQFQFEHLYAFRIPSWLITLKDIGRAHV